MKNYGYNCPVCGEPIKEPQPTEHTDEGLAHAKCCGEKSQPTDARELAETVALEIIQRIRAQFIVLSKSAEQTIRDSVEAHINTLCTELVEVKRHRDSHAKNLQGYQDAWYKCQAELDQLQKDNAELIKQRNAERNAFNPIGQKLGLSDIDTTPHLIECAIENLQKTIVELLKDKERLDYLEHGCNGTGNGVICSTTNGVKSFLVSCGLDNLVTKGQSLRTALDECIRKENKL